MEKQNRKIICQDCKGNGFIYVDRDKDLFNVRQCTTCKSQGELTVDFNKELEEMTDFARRQC